MPVNKRSTRRKRVVRKRKNVFKQFFPDEAETGKTLWVRRLLEIYMSLPEFESPTIDPATGLIERDQFGRVRHEITPSDMLRKGIWLSKQALVVAWKEVFGQDYNYLDHPEHYEETHNPLSLDARTARVAKDAMGLANLPLDGRFRLRDRPSWSHPMDAPLADMCRGANPGMIHLYRDCYFPSKAECLDAWRDDPAKGERVWNTFVVRRGREETNLRGARNVKQHGWDDLFVKLEDYAAFDKLVVERLADRMKNPLTEEPMFAEGADKENIIHSHLARWLKAGKIVKLTNTLYQTYHEGYTPARRYWKVLDVRPLNWLDRIIIRVNQYQFENGPDWTFTIHDVLEWSREEPRTRESRRILFYAAMRKDRSPFVRAGTSAGCYRLAEWLVSALNHVTDVTPLPKTPELRVIESEAVKKAKRSDEERAAARAAKVSAEGR